MLGNGTLIFTSIVGLGYFKINPPKIILGLFRIREDCKDSITLSDNLLIARVFEFFEMYQSSSIKKML